MDLCICVALLRMFDGQQPIVNKANALTRLHGGAFHFPVATNISFHCFVTTAALSIAGSHLQLCPLSSSHQSQIFALAFFLLWGLAYLCNFWLNHLRNNASSPSSPTSLSVQKRNMRNHRLLPYYSIVPYLPADFAKSHLGILHYSAIAMMKFHYCTIW